VEDDGRTDTRAHTGGNRQHQGPTSPTAYLNISRLVLKRILYFVLSDREPVIALEALDDHVGDVRRHRAAALAVGQGESRV
jgi:hypothetical protein